jgi:methylamine dehydrogenase light chain
MPENFENKQKKFDEVTTKALTSLAERISRRNMLARLGNFTLALMGASVIPLLPVDRVMRTANGQTTLGCGAWQLCGIYGRLCSNCNCPSGTAQSCPRCTHQGSEWQSCCPVRDGNNQPTGERRTVRYIDCCGQQGDPNCNGNANNCDSGQFCGNNTQPNWCGGAGGNAYHCTHFIVMNAC